MKRHARPFTIAYVDLDNFKQINDTFGHAAGDQFLRDVSQQISRRLRVTDSLARLGGDEFVVLLPETDQAAAQLVLTDIHKSLQHVVADRDYKSTASVGAVTFHSSGDAEKMIAIADEAMYAVKQSGKNKVEWKLVA
jgi:diguanylate cyclase (GGDEF)-like protein